MVRTRPAAALCLVALLTACGGGGGSTPVTNGTTGGTTGTTPTPTPVASGCTLRARQEWAAAQLREWYLFPETLPATLDPAPYATVSDYVDALTATARAQGRDRFFTYVTSIAQENAFNSTGATAGFGMRIAVDLPARRLFVSEVFEGGMAIGAGLDRGTEILAIGTDAASLRTVPDLLASGGEEALDFALGPPTAGTSRLLRVRDPIGTRDVMVGKTDYILNPVSGRYGIRIFDNGARRAGYVNLRTFISSADPTLRNVFAQLRAEGITDMIVDLRYNGGGLIATAELLNDLLGGNRSTGDVQGYTSFRPEKSSNDTVRLFRTEGSAVSPTRIAFIGTGQTASASELVINAFTPYLRDASALIGSNTYGKPVGQIALDRPECDDRLRVVALAVQNSARSAAYYNGLAGTVAASCQAADDLAVPFGDAREASIARALDFLAGRPCTPIPSATAATATAAARTAGEIPTAGGISTRTPLTPTRPDPAQRQVPGLF